MLREKFAGRRGSDGERKRRRRERAKSSVRARKLGMRRKEEEGAVSPYIGRRDSGLETAGPRRFASWAATWREDTRAENRKPQGRRTDPERRPGSGVPQLIRAQKPKGSDP